MNTIDNLLDTISKLNDVVRIQREIIKGLGGNLLPTAGNFDLRSINQDILKGCSASNETAEQRNKKAYFKGVNKVYRKV